MKDKHYEEIRNKLNNMSDEEFIDALERAESGVNMDDDYILVLEEGTSSDIPISYDLSYVYSYNSAYADNHSTEIYTSSFKVLGAA